MSYFDHRGDFRLVGPGPDPDRKFLLPPLFVRGALGRPRVRPPDANRGYAV